MIKRSLVIALAAGAVAVPGVAAANKGGVPSHGRSPAWWCRTQHTPPLTPHSAGWSQCVRDRAHTQRNTDENNKPDESTNTPGSESSEPGDEVNKPEDTTGKSDQPHGQSDQPHGQSGESHGKHGKPDTSD